MTAEMKVETACAGCGMLTGSPREYHPWAVCELFKATRNSRSTVANIAAVVEYGMKAQKAGVSIEDAMRDFNLVLAVNKGSAAEGWK